VTSEMREPERRGMRAMPPSKQESRRKEAR